jgi:hypothetical protein
MAAALALMAYPSGLWAAPPPPPGGTISLAPKTANGDYDASLQSFVEATSEALGVQGFTILDADHAAYSAELILSRVEVGTGTAKVPQSRSSVDRGGAFGSVGAGVTIPLTTGKSSIVRAGLLPRIRRGMVADSASWYVTTMLPGGAPFKELAESLGFEEGSLSHPASFVVERAFVG